MKTISKKETYDRVDNELAEIRVKNQGWKYVPKEKWKQEVRGINKKKIEEIETEVEVKKPYRKPKRS